MAIHMSQGPCAFQDRIEGHLGIEVTHIFMQKENGGEVRGERCERGSGELQILELRLHP